MAEQGERVSVLYKAALARAPEDRSDFLQQVCKGDETLRREVESLLRSASASKQLLEPTGTLDMSDVPAGTDLIGLRLGSYEVSHR